MWLWLRDHFLCRAVDSVLPQTMPQISSEGNGDGKSTYELSETEDFADCMEDFPFGLDEEAIGEAMNSEQESAGASTNLISGLPDDFVVVQIWPLIASPYATLRGVNRKWRQLVRTSPEWLAVEVVILGRTVIMKKRTKIFEAKTSRDQDAIVLRVL
ncbi:hypothetical protein R1sor_024430 [Riccia sorocarpa]|uniref:F-box domain-containing protein n=1 Tax=Riccia sorocarpa TaxID=122646 RepID=A0ABD3GUG3_9MARC